MSHTKSSAFPIAKFARIIGAFLPLRSYGELVLHPVTLAERAAGEEIAFSTAEKNR
jgi:hypothetical protein